MCISSFFPNWGQYLFEGKDLSEVDEIIRSCEFILADRDSNIPDPEPPFFKPDYSYSCDDVETKLWRAEIIERYDKCMKCSHQIYKLEREKRAKDMLDIKIGIDAV
jgi:hypothetical protein